MISHQKAPKGYDVLIVANGHDWIAEMVAEIGAALAAGQKVYVGAGDVDYRARLKKLVHYEAIQAQYKVKLADLPDFDFTAEIA